MLRLAGSGAVGRSSHRPQSQQNLCCVSFTQLHDCGVRLAASASAASKLTSKTSKDQLNAQQQLRQRPYTVYVQLSLYRALDAKAYVYSHLWRCNERYTLITVRQTVHCVCQKVLSRLDTWSIAHGVLEFPRLCSTLLHSASFKFRNEPQSLRMISNLHSTAGPLCRFSDSTTSLLPFLPSRTMAFAPRSSKGPRRCLYSNGPAPNQAPSTTKLSLNFDRSAGSGNGDASSVQGESELSSCDSAARFEMTFSPHSNNTAW